MCELNKLLNDAIKIKSKIDKKEKEIEYLRDFLEFHIENEVKDKMILSIPSIAVLKRELNKKEGEVDNVENLDPKKYNFIDIRFSTKELINNTTSLLNSRVECLNNLKSNFNDIGLKLKL